jgi:hypothetical protein
MADLPQAEAPPQSQVEGETKAKELERYHESHPQTPTARYHKYLAEIAKHVIESAGERERRAQEIKRTTEYARRAKQRQEAT